MKRLINLTPPPASRLFLGLLPFALLLLLYVIASDARLAENANDKLLPAFSQMGEAIDRMAEAHSTGVALLLVCHQERAELYAEQFASLSITISIEPDEA